MSKKSISFILIASLLLSFNAMHSAELPKNHGALSKLKSSFKKLLKPKAPKQEALKQKQIKTNPHAQTAKYLHAILGIPPLQDIFLDYHGGPYEPITITIIPVYLPVEQAEFTGDNELTVRTYPDYDNKHIYTIPAREDRKYDVGGGLIIQHRLVRPKFSLDMGRGNVDPASLTREATSPLYKATIEYDEKRVEYIDCVEMNGKIIDSTPDYSFGNHHRTTIMIFERSKWDGQLVAALQHARNPAANKKS